MPTDQELLKSVKGIGPKRYERISAHMQAAHKPLGDIFSMSALEIKHLFNIPINIAEAIPKLKQESDQPEPSALSTDSKGLTPPTAFNVRSQSFSTDILTILEVGSPRYPQKLAWLLGAQAPQKLYTWGNLELLEQPSVGFCGSRNVSEKGLQVTSDTVQQLAAHGWVIVSGHARGVDTTAHISALKHNTGTIIVLPQGMEGFKLRRDIRALASKDKLLIVSEFPLHARWHVGNAMQRNKTIIGLSDAMVLVESRLEGGTFAAGEAALRLKHPLFVADYAEDHAGNEGNSYFLRLGAIPLRKSKQMDRANIKPLVESVQHKLMDRKNSLSSMDAAPAKQLALLKSEE